MNRVLLLAISIALVVGLTNCKSKEETTTASVSRKGMAKEDSVRKAFGNNTLGPNVGMSRFDRNTAGIDVKIVSLKRSGGELLFDIVIKKVAGVGASTPMPALNQKLSLTYSEQGSNQEVVKALKSGDKVYMIISHTTSITEPRGTWSCERILAAETQQ